MTVAGANRSIHEGTWCQAIKKEMQGLIESKTFTAVDELPQGKKVVGLSCVMSDKSDKDGQTT